MKKSASWKPSLLVASYEIPNPLATMFVIHTAIVVVPAAILAVAHKPLGVAIVIAVGLGFFHLRNVAVRAENERGIHKTT